MTKPAADRITEGLTEALAIAKGEAAPIPTIHPIPGKCVYCDNRRTVNAAAAQRRRARQKEPT